MIIFESVPSWEDGKICKFVIRTKPYYLRKIKYVIEEVHYDKGDDEEN